MKIKKNLEPLISGISAAIVIGILAFLTLRTSAGVWSVSYTQLTLPTKA